MNITVYVSTHCPYCHAATVYLDQKNIEYDLKNIDLDPNLVTELNNRLPNGFRGVPVIDINGIFIEGFDQAKIEQALSL